MKSQLKDWIAEGKIVEVLDALIPLTDDAILVRSSYISTKRRYDQGLLEHSALSQAQARATDAALQLINRYVQEGEAPKADLIEKPIDTPRETVRSGPKTKVFISYNHKDSEMVDRIDGWLTAQGYEVLRDTKIMATGEVIQDFIDRMIKTKGVVLSVVSRNSLSSGWVGVESNLAQYARFFGVSRFVPVRIDEALFDERLSLDVAKSLRLQIAEIDALIEESKTEGIPFDQYTTKRKRLEDLRHNLPKIINQLQEVLVSPLSADDTFEATMEKIMGTV
jgi:TIR domain